MKKVGLALAGGGLKGSYQIGSYYAFKKMRINFNGIVGTSIGALNGSIIASGNYKELMKLWENIEPGVLMEMDPEVVRAMNMQEVNIKTLFGIIRSSKEVLKNKGLPLKNIKDLAEPYINPEKIKNSNIDYGLATYNYTKKKPIYMYKEDIPTDKFVDFIMASCSLPIFKLGKIDNDLYLDGLFHDNCPTSMLIDKGYDTIYEVKINGLGINKKIKSTKTKIITISPSRDIGKITEMNHEKIMDNIFMGYYDTLKKLNYFDGYQYTFKKVYFLNTKKLDKIDKFTLNRVKNFFNEFEEKNLIIKCVEYIMKHENYEYNRVYNLYKVLKHIPNRDNFVYNFIKKYKNL